MGNQMVKNKVREYFDLRAVVVHNQLLDFRWKARRIILLFLDLLTISLPLLNPFIYLTSYKTADGNFSLIFT